MAVMIVVSELFGPQKRIGQIGQQPQRDDRREYVVEDQLRLLEPVADICIRNGRREKDGAQCQDDHVHHGVLLSQELESKAPTTRA